MTRDRVVGIVVLVWALGAIGWAAWRAQQGSATEDELIVMPASKSDAGAGFGTPQQAPPVFLTPSKSDAGVRELPQDIGNMGDTLEPVFLNGSKSGLPTGKTPPIGSPAPIEEALGEDADSP